MNISTKSEYGLRALIYLASCDEAAAIPARLIAKKWNVPGKYLEQILKSLKESGFVTSQVGVGGGYRLARPASLITVGEIVRELDGRLSPTACASSFDYEPCEFESACGLKTLWARARSALVNVLDQTTLADLCTRADRPRTVSLGYLSGRF